MIHISLSQTASNCLLFHCASASRNFTALSLGISSKGREVFHNGLLPWDLNEQMNEMNVVHKWVCAKPLGNQSSTIK